MRSSNRKSGYRRVIVVGHSVAEVGLIKEIFREGDVQTLDWTLDEAQFSHPRKHLMSKLHFSKGPKEFSNMMHGKLKGALIVVACDCSRPRPNYCGKWGTLDDTLNFLKEELRGDSAELVFVGTSRSCDESKFSEGHLNDRRANQTKALENHYFKITKIPKTWKEISVYCSRRAPGEKAKKAKTKMLKLAAEPVRICQDFIDELKLIIISCLTDMVKAMRKAMREGQPEGNSKRILPKGYFKSIEYRVDGLLVALSDIDAKDQPTDYSVNDYFYFLGNIDKIKAVFSFPDYVGGDEAGSVDSDKIPLETLELRIKGKYKISKPIHNVDDLVEAFVMRNETLAFAREVREAGYNQHDKMLASGLFQPPAGGPGGRGRALSAGGESASQYALGA